MCVPRKGQIGLAACCSSQRLNALGGVSIKPSFGDDVGCEGYQGQVRTRSFLSGACILYDLPFARTGGISAARRQHAHAAYLERDLGVIASACPCG